MTLQVKWIDGHREPTQKPDPQYPQGIDLDLSRGAATTCSVRLPYPARRCGYYRITCEVCHQRNIVTTAGRPDDPRSFKVACALPAGAA